MDESSRQDAEHHEREQKHRRQAPGNALPLSSEILETPWAAALEAETDRGRGSVSGPAQPDEWRRRRRRGKPGRQIERDRHRGLAAPGD